MGMAAGWGRGSPLPPMGQSLPSVVLHQGNLLHEHIRMIPTSHKGLGYGGHSSWHRPLQALPPSLSLPTPSSRESPQPEPALGDRAPWGRGPAGVDGCSGVRRARLPDQVDAPGRREGPRGVGWREEGHPQNPAPGGLSPWCFLPGAAACPRPARRAPGSAGRTPVPPLHRSLSQGPGAWPCCLACEAASSMRSPSGPATGVGPAATLCPSTTAPVGDRCSAPSCARSKNSPEGPQTLPAPGAQGL